MKNVGVAVATSAWLLASADERDALAVTNLIAEAATRRLALEREQGAGLVSRAADRAAAEAVEQNVTAAWTKWYAEALDSVLSLPVAGSTDVLRARVGAAKDALTSRSR
jgi:hypothetical protein